MISRGLTVFASVWVLVLGLVGASPFSLAAQPSVAKNYESYLLTLTAMDEARQQERSRLLKLEKKEVAGFIEAARVWLKSESLRERTLLSFDLLRRHKRFDREMARAMLSVIESVSKSPEQNPLLGERRLAVLLRAKAGRLEPQFVSEELLLASDVARSAPERTLAIAGLIDAMAEAGIKPTGAQLVSLLKNDVFEIRMNAVDWFRIDGPKEINERRDFVKTAIVTKPKQVRERMFRTLLGWKKSDIRQVISNGDIELCLADPEIDVRNQCSQLKQKIGSGGT